MHGAPAPRGQRGFTLVELLVVACIVICLMTLVVPGVRIALGKSRVVRAMNDCKRVGDAMASWAILHGAAPSPTVADNAIDLSNYTPIHTHHLRKLLVPDFLLRVPERDPWGNPYLYFLDEEDPHGPDVALCASGGEDGNVEGGSYTIGPIPPTDFTQDLIWADGDFIRWPE